MHIDYCKSKQRGKIYTSILLRHSFRIGNKIKHETILNLSKYPEEDIKALNFSLKNKKEIAKFSDITDCKCKSQQGKSIGVICLLKSLADRLHITKALGNTRNGKLALWQIMTRIINKSSRLGATRLAEQHAICDLLNLESFNEEHLYDNLDWLSENQHKIEKKLFKMRYKENNPPKLFLYDVTSSYLEGTKNEFANWGYNRDKKKGKMQIVIGLLTDSDGIPISVEVFEGNTNDPKTVLNQVKKLSNHFGVEQVTFVGDRGMIKTNEINIIQDKHFNYITGITKPQIKTLIKNETIQMTLFGEDTLCEVEKDDIRYILKRNPVRAEEIKVTRNKKIDKIIEKIKEKNDYLANHKRAKVSVAARHINKYIEKFNIAKYAEIIEMERSIALKIDEEKKLELSELDGCYVIKTDLSKRNMSAEDVHRRYKDLYEVETAFRTMKTGFLKTRPYFVRKKSRTKGHVFVVMLAYIIVKELKKLWKTIDITVEEGIDELSGLNTVIFNLGPFSFQEIPNPRKLSAQLLKIANVALPKILHSKNVKIYTRKKLTSRRKP